MASIDLASNSALLSVAEKLDAQNTISNSVAEKLERQNNILYSMALKNDTLPVTDWKDVQHIVRSGYAPEIFNLGDQLVCNHEEFGELVWDIVGFDCETPVDSAHSHSMTLMLHTACIELPFSEKEALFCNLSATAGVSYKYTDRETGSYNCFEATNSCSGNNLVVLNTDNKPNTLDVYPKPVNLGATPTYSFPTLTYSSSNDSSYTSLSNWNINYRGRVIRGNDSWRESSIRQWLSSDAGEGNWYKYDMNINWYSMPPSYISRAGFLNKIDPDFKSVLGKVIKRTGSHEKAGKKLIETQDIMFLPSLSELYCTSKNNIVDGEAYPYFKNFAASQEPSDAADPIRTRGGIPGKQYSKYWTRSCGVDNETGRAWMLSSDTGGIYGQASACWSYGIVPLCCIC